jgi:hypothetical protein
MSDCTVAGQLFCFFYLFCLSVEMLVFCEVVKGLFLKQKVKRVKVEAFGMET